MDKESGEFFNTQLEHRSEWHGRFLKVLADCIDSEQRIKFNLPGSDTNIFC
jgi:hypothetical protein